MILALLMLLAGSAQAAEFNNVIVDANLTAAKVGIGTAADANIPLVVQSVSDSYPGIMLVAGSGASQPDWYLYPASSNTFVIESKNGLFSNIQMYYGGENGYHIAAAPGTISDKFKQMPGEVGIAIFENASSPGDLQEWLTSGGSILGKMDNAGNMTATSFIGPLTGKSSTATALAATPSQCTGGQVSTGIAANGNANCTAGGGTPGGSSTDIQYNSSGSFAGDSGMSYNGSQVTFDLVDSYGGFHVMGKSGGEASFALQPDNVSNGSAGQWIFYTNGSGLHNQNDFAMYDSATGAPALILQAATGYVGLGTNNPSTELQVAGTVTATAFAGPLTGNVTGNVSGTSGNITATSNSSITTLSSLASIDSGVTANYFMASPSGSSGAMTPRAIVAADVPTLNQATTSTAANLSGTPALPNGTTGTTQTETDTSTKLATDAFVANIATLGSLSSIDSGVTANFFMASPNGTTGALTPRAIVAADIPTLNQATTSTAANLSGTPALPNGTTGTTQTSSDTSTKLATDAFVASYAPFPNPSPSPSGCVPTANGNLLGYSCKATWLNNGTLEYYYGDLGLGVNGGSGHSASVEIGTIGNPELYLDGGSADVKISMNGPGSVYSNIATGSVGGTSMAFGFGASQSTAPTAVLTVTQTAGVTIGTTSTTQQHSINTSTASVSNCGATATACIQITINGTTHYIPYY